MGGKSIRFLKKKQEKLNSTWSPVGCNAFTFGNTLIFALILIKKYRGNSDYEDNEIGWLLPSLTDIGGKNKKLRIIKTG